MTEPDEQPYDGALDSYRAWLEALRLAREGHEALREWFAKRADAA